MKTTPSGISKNCKEYRNATPETLISCECGWNGRFKELRSSRVFARDKKLLFEFYVCPNCQLMHSRAPWKRKILVDLGEILLHAYIRKDLILARETDKIINRIFPGSELYKFVQNKTIDETTDSTESESMDSRSL